MIGDAHSLTPGYVRRHIPPASGIGLDIAVLNIAQDFLLAHLSRAGVFPDLVVFKGGTALRKLFVGSQGRFSTDLDLAAVESGGDRAALAELVADQARTTLGPFRFEPDCKRGRWHIHVHSPYADSEIAIKLDVGPPCWIEPELRSFVEHPTQRRYGFDLPSLPCVRLEEILAEKIARLIAAGHGAGRIGPGVGCDHEPPFTILCAVRALAIRPQSVGRQPRITPRLASGARARATGT